ncbi:MAG TPA: hypothetical protein PK580_00205 [Nitrosomonas halophila]|nr:hypothetical protein [Nitrosomonas halophila]
MARPIHLAWGGGDAAWDTDPVPETVNDAVLVDEIGRRLVSQARYCLPDETGEIIVPTGRFTESSTPTRHIYLRFNFDFDDAPAATIREVAVFVGTQTDAGLPPGQMYFEPENVVDPGTLLVIERTQKFDRSPSVRQSFEFVITF